ncbi:XdhC family protein [Peribacillus sp. NPDC058075]|uniref:XdhC family protein n=1 Tax=unclassified Peribacillus TaxID=2675266 RepID=UPI0036DB8FD1
MITIINEMDRCIREKKRGILATVIRVEGSTYQKEGAKCFFAEDGELIGLLSGGCVEGDVLEHGKEVLQTEKPKKIHYDFRGEEDQIWGLGVGCNGAIEIFIELFDPVGHHERSKLMREAFTTSQPIIIATITSDEEESMIGERWVHSNLQIGKPMDLKMIDNSEVFYDHITPVPTLYIFGAGPDAVPLVKTVKNLGWNVNVLDHRPGFVNKRNFPLADELICYERDHPTSVLSSEHSYAIVMSHNFTQDQLVLKSLLHSSVPYIGVLGPTTRTNQLLQPIMDGFTIDEIQLNRIYSPIGLDIGAKTPEEIAISIAAELVNVHRGGNSMHLKQTKGKELLNTSRDHRRVIAYQ